MALPVDDALSSPTRPESPASPEKPSGSPKGITKITEFVLNIPCNEHENFPQQNVLDLYQQRMAAIASQGPPWYTILLNTLKSWKCRQWSMFTFVLFIVSWCYLTAFLMMMASLEYANGVVSKDTVVYVVIAASWAQAETRKSILSALGAYEAIQASLRTGYMRGADTLKLQVVLTPIFVSADILHTVEVVFPRESPNTVLSIGRTANEGTGAVELITKSNGPECFLLGPDACMAHAPNNGNLDWWNYFSSPTANPFPGGGKYADPRDRWEWEGTPSMSMEIVEDDDSNLKIERWFPVGNFVFRLAGSAEGDDEEESTRTPAIMARVTVNLGFLSGKLLQDSGLGPEARIYLCDNTGLVLSSAQPSGFMYVSKSGRMRLLYLSEIASASWGAATEELILQRENFQLFAATGEYIAGFFFDGFLEHLVIVVVVPDKDPFINGDMRVTTFFCMVLAMMPPSVAGFIIVVFFLHVAWEKSVEAASNIKSMLAQSSKSAKVTVSARSSGRSSFVARAMRRSAVRRMDSLMSRMQNAKMEKRLDVLEGKAAAADAIPPDCATSQGSISALREQSRWNDDATSAGTSSFGYGSEPSAPFNRPDS